MQNPTTAAEAIIGLVVLTIAAGGFARLFERDGLFDVLVPDLVLVGLKRALALNPGGSSAWTAAGDQGGLQSGD